MGDKASKIPRDEKVKFENAINIRRLRCRPATKATGAFTHKGSMPENEFVHLLLTGGTWVIQQLTLAGKVQ